MKITLSQIYSKRIYHSHNDGIIVIFENTSELLLIVTKHTTPLQNINQFGTHSGE
jgi:hypothetical protein